MRPEGRFWTKLRARVGGLGGYAVKIAAGPYQTTGLPDSLLILDGCANFVELKAVDALPARPGS